MQHDIVGKNVFQIATIKPRRLNLCVQAGIVKLGDLWN